MIYPQSIDSSLLPLLGEHKMKTEKRPSPTHIIAVDIGTTTIRSCLFAVERCERIGEFPDTVEVDYDATDGKAEIDPDNLWSKFVSVVKRAQAAAPSGAVLSLSFCTQRNSFLTYDKTNLVPTSKIILWNDKRAKAECERKNKTWKLKLLNLGAALLHCVIRLPRLRAAMMLRFIGSMVSFRVVKAIKESPVNQSLLAANKLAYACLDTWIILKLTGGKHLATEPSNVSATGLFDPFIGDYNYTVLGWMVHFPRHLLVPITESAVTGRPHCHTDPALFGHSMPLHAVLADQQSALFGCGGLRRGDTMISMGTGIFLQKNLEDKPHASMKGLYPLVAWKVDGVTTFLAEGQQHQSAACIEWAQSQGYFSDVRDTSNIAFSVSDSNAVTYVPAIGGLQTPYDDDRAIDRLFDERRTETRGETTDAHRMRAVLEGLAFRVHEIFGTMEREIVSKEKSSIRICGGISANDFVCQTIATLINRPVERITDSSYAAARGVALMAGISLGAWRMEDVSSMVSVERTFNPKSEDRTRLMETFALWQKDVQKCLGKRE